MEDRPTTQVAVPPHDPDFLEHWVRSTVHDPLGYLSAVHWRSPDDPTLSAWDLTFGCLEYVRGDPLESELRGAIVEELMAVQRVFRVELADREKYEVFGDPTGPALIAAGVTAVERFEAEILQYRPWIGIASSRSSAS